MNEQSSVQCWVYSISVLANVSRGHEWLPETSKLVLESSYFRSYFGLGVTVKAKISWDVENKYILTDNFS